MASLNKVMLIGNLGKDPEVRYTASGMAVASFSIATTDRIKNKSGEYEDKTEWHNITLWGKQAEFAKNYLTKGRTVFVEGRLQTRKWQDRDGKDRWTTEVVGDRIQAVSPKGEGGGTGNRPARQEEGFSGAPSYEDPSFNPDDDIPF